MILRLHKAFFIAVAGLLIISGCSKPVQRSSTSSIRNMAYLYNPSSSPLHPEFSVFHEHTVLSRLYVKLYTVELLFNQANREGTYQARVKFHYELREVVNGSESGVIADSATLEYTLKRTDIKEVFFTSIPLSADLNKIYTLKIYTTDVLRNKGTMSFLDVDKSSVHTSQHFKVISPLTGYPYFDEVFNENDMFQIKYAGKNIDTVFVKYYKTDFPLPRPPITNIKSPRPDFIPDSLYAYPYNDTTKFILPFEGMYHIQADLNQPAGLTLFNFGTSYPRVTTIDEMIGPVAYLTSSMEFNELANQTNKKLAVDNFWLQCAGNAATARELIRIYYNRVFFANYYFTSYKQGWKTDRGMMFIIYGPPNKLSKSAEAEVWTFFRKKGREPLRFTFSKVATPYSDNDFMLERNYVNAMWTQAISEWRQGKVFYTDNL